MLSDSLTTPQITEALYPRAIKAFPSVSSTNDIAMLWMNDGAAAGSVVVAEEQTKGRGRLGRSWFAPAGSALMFSVVLKPPVEAIGRISMLGALSVCGVLRDMGIANVGIKWPNDVQVIQEGVRRKLCGVLPESTWNGAGFAGVVLGIGVNIRIDFANTPFSETAASLESILGQPINRIELLKQILTRIDCWTAEIQQESFFEAWRTSLNMLGQPIMVEGQRGTAHDVGRDGALIVRGEDGSLRRVIAGDIALGDR